MRSPSLRSRSVTLMSSFTDVNTPEEYRRIPASVRELGKVSQGLRGWDCTQEDYKGVLELCKT